jgi:ribosomal protein S27E
MSLMRGQRRKNMGKNRSTKEVKGLVKEENGKTLVYLGGKWIQGGRDENGVFYLTKCVKCGNPVRQYLGRRGPKALYCSNCKSNSAVRVQDGKLVTRRGILEIVEE